MSFLPTDFSEAYVGAKIKKSKKRVTWDFNLDDQTHRIVFEASYITSKRKVAFDGSCLYKGPKGLGRDFVYCFILLNHSFRVIERKHFLDLFIDSFSFNQLFASRLSDPRESHARTPPKAREAKPGPAGLEEHKTPPQLTSDFLELSDDQTQIFSPSAQKQANRDIFAVPQVQVGRNPKDVNLLDL